MKLIFIYGPPAVGKYTVGRELAKLTGYKLLHNHLTVDMVASVFGFKNKEVWLLVGRFREELVEAAARTGVSIIMTSVYMPEDAKHVRKLVNTVRRYKGRILFVRLHTDVKTLHHRRRGVSRKSFSKLKDAKSLNGLLKGHDLFATVAYRPNISIDNTNLSPRAVAMMIARRYRLNAVE